MTLAFFVAAGSARACASYPEVEDQAESACGQLCIDLSNSAVGESAYLLVDDSDRIADIDAPEPAELIGSLAGWGDAFLVVPDRTTEEEVLPQEAAGSAVFAVSFTIAGVLFSAALISGMAFLRLRRQKYRGFDPGRHQPGSIRERFFS